MPDAATVQRRFVLAALLAVVARLVHDVEEFGAPSPDFIVTGFLIPFLLAVLIPRMPHPAGIAWAAVAWGVLNVVGGGFSVLPLPFLPFEPAQTVSHYLAHVAYAGGYVPFTWLAWRVIRVGK